MRKYLSILTITLALIFPVSIHALTETVNPAHEQDLEQWRTLVYTKQKEVAHFKDLSTVTSQYIKKDINELSLAREKTDFKIDQLRFNLLVGTRSPYEYRQAIKDICNVVSSFKKTLDQDRQYLETLDNYIKMLQDISDSIKSLRQDQELTTEMDNLLQSTSEDVKTTYNNFVSMRDNLKNEIAKCVSFSGVSIDNPIQFEKTVFEQLNDFYLKPDTSLFSQAAWGITVFLGSDWRANFLLKLEENLPDTLGVAISLCCYIASALIVFFILRLVLIKKFKPSEKNTKIISRCLLWFLLGIAFIAFDLQLPVLAKNYIYNLLALICLIKGLLWFSWGLKVKERDSQEKRSPLEPLFWIYVYAGILQFVDHYYVVMSILWIIGVIISGIVMISASRRHTLYLDKVLISFSVIICLISFVGALSGFLYSSILLMMAWSLFCLSVELSINARDFLINLVSSFDTGKYILPKILLVGSSIPIIWLILLIILIFWGIWQIFGTFFFVTSINTTFAMYGLRISLAYIAFGVYLFFVFKTVLGFIHLTINRLRATNKLNAGVAPSISVLANYVVWSIYILILLKLFGGNLTSLAVVTGGLSVGIGFGMRDVLNNFVSGLIILLGRSIRVGDIIEVDGLTGKITGITIRSTVVDTFENAVVSIPNSTIISNKLINWTMDNPIVRKSINIGVAYDSDIKKVKSILLKVANENELVIKEPNPAVYLLNFADNSISILLLVWCNISSSYVVVSNILERINEEFIRNSIEMPFPQMDINFKKPEALPKGAEIIPRPDK